MAPTSHKPCPTCAYPKPEGTCPHCSDRWSGPRAERPRVRGMGALLEEDPNRRLSLKRIAGLFQRLKPVGRQLYTTHAEYVRIKRRGTETHEGAELWNPFRDVHIEKLGGR